MVSSPNYDRLKTFMETARVNKDLSAWDKDHEKAVQGFEKTIEDLHAYRDSHGFVGVTGKAMDRWVEDSVKRIEKYKEAYERGYRKYCRGRGVMATALAEGEKLSAELIDAATEAMRDDLVVSVPDREPGPGIRFMGKLYTTGAAYVEAVEAQANAQREAAAERILSMLNSRTTVIGESMVATPDGVTPRKDLAEYEEEQRKNNQGGGIDGDGMSGGGAGAGGSSDWGYSRDDDFGRSEDRSSTSSNYPGGFDQPWWSEADAAAARSRIVSSGAVETRELPYGEIGSRTNPITDPQELMSRDLLHTRVNGTIYRNGVVGGQQARSARVHSVYAARHRWASVELPEAWPGCVVLPARPMAWAPLVPPPSRLVPTPVLASAPTLHPQAQMVVLLAPQVQRVGVPAVSWEPARPRVLVRARKRRRGAGASTRPLGSTTTRTSCLRVT